MEHITEIHEEVYQFLESYRAKEKLKQRNFYYTFRRSNQKNRLDEGYWFYGNEDYLAISFWSGMDWKNKTPNIFLRITSDKRVFLTFSFKDSIIKSENCKKYFVEPFELKPNGVDRWKKELSGRDYIAIVENFLKNEKVDIDAIILNNKNELLSEDSSNSIGFIDGADFEKWHEYVVRYRNKSIEKDLPFSLSSFTVEKYIPIDKISFNRIGRKTQFIFIVGENGSGKSSLLKSLATAVGNKYYNPEYSPDNSTWIIDYTLNIRGNSVRNKLTIYEPTKLGTPNIPFVCFGPSRLVIQNRMFGSDTNKNTLSRLSPLRSIFYPDAILKDINRWIINALADSKSPDRKASSKLMFENIKQMLINTIPNLYDIRETPWDNTQELLYFEEDFEGNKIEKGVIFEHLSSGLRSLIAMLGDMMLRLFEQQESIVDPSELGGIVLIDEIDIHLHPKWQKKVPEILAEYFPKIQFIVTTHSPIPLLGAPRNSRIYVLKRMAQKGICIERMDDKVMFSEILPNAILTSPIFGLEEITPISKDNNHQTNVEDDYREIEVYEKIENDVSKYLTNSVQKKLIALFKNER